MILAQFISIILEKEIDKGVGFCRIAARFEVKAKRFESELINKQRETNRKGTWLEF